MIKNHRTLPDAPTGYPLDNQFAIIVPAARTNLCTNPSIETGTTGWGGFATASVARVATQQYHGAYSLQVTPTSGFQDGASFSSIAMVTGTTYAVSAKVLCVKGVKYQIAVYSGGGTRLASREFFGTGRWQWVYTYYTETASNSRSIVVSKVNSSSTGLFYVDGVQCESITAGDTVSTYIDGDQLGLLPNQSPPAYGWNGTPHASTSYRTILTRAGGTVVPLSKYNFLLTAIIGLGLATPQNTVTEYARLDGGYPDYTRKPTRQFSLAGSFQASSYTRLRDARGQVGRLLDRDQASLDQPLLLRHTLGDSQAAIIPAKYSGGLGGSTDNHYAEAAALSFVQYLPYVQAEGESGAALTVQLSVSNANQILLRSAAGSWSAIGTGATASFTYAITPGATDQYLYIGGSFTSFNGVANTRAIARYDTITGTISAMGTGGPASAQVYVIAVGPNGHVWAIGSFTAMGGAANSANVAEWSGSAWSGHTYPGTGVPNSIAIGPNGVVYIGSDSGQVHKWDGSSWALLGTAAGSGANVLALTVGPDGSLYAGGDFTSVSAVSAASIIKYTLTAAAPAWVALNNAPASRVYQALAFTANGILYAGGTDSTGTTPYVYQYNGTQFASLGTFTGNGSYNEVFALRPVTGGVLIGGAFNAFNGIAFPDGLGFWNGGTLVPYDADLPGSPATVFAIGVRPDGVIAVGTDTTGTATVAGITTATNAGTARTYPALTIKGPSSGTSRIYQLLNTTTGRSIFLNYTINAGETARFVFQPDNLFFQSDFVGNLASKILPGSSESDFFLAPGANTISFYAADSSVVATLTWHSQYLNLDDIAQ